MGTASPEQSVAAGKGGSTAKGGGGREIGTWGAVYGAQIYLSGA